MVLGGLPGPIDAQSASPTATLTLAPMVQLTGDVDSNSPAIWDLVDGQPLLHVFTSTNGQTSLSTGVRLARLGEAQSVSFGSHPGHGVWMEAVVADDTGTWYGYYHNEVPADECGRSDRALPRIGAARSRDRGATWHDLGIVLEAPPGWHACQTRNRYFVGGVGDLSAVLDQDAKDLYIFFSQYSRYAEAQGVAVARMVWAVRDEPVGRVNVWVAGVWQPPAVVDTGAGGEQAEPIWVYPAGTPLVPVTRPWHDANPANDAFWGASVHWNSYLKHYVMLLNRAQDDGFDQEGIYVAFAPSLEIPSAWSPPKRILAGGRWYPQVIGLDRGAGTDKEAGARARFFTGGTSDYFIDFARPADGTQDR